MASLRYNFPALITLAIASQTFAQSDEAPVRADAERPTSVSSLSLSVGTTFAAMLAGNQRVARLAQQNSIGESQRTAISFLGLKNGECGTLAVNFSSKAVAAINAGNITGGPALITQTFKIQDGSAVKIGDANYQAGELKTKFGAADYSYQAAPTLIDEIEIRAAKLKICPAPR